MGVICKTNIDIITSSRLNVKALHIPVTFFSPYIVLIVREGIISPQYLPPLCKTAELILLCGSMQGIPLFTVTVQTESIHKVVDIAVIPAHFCIPDDQHNSLNRLICCTSYYPVKIRAQRRETETNKANYKTKNIIVNNKNETKHMGDSHSSDAMTAAKSLNSDNVIDTTPAVTPAVAKVRTICHDCLITRLI